MTQKPPIERFLALTQIVPGGCWLWLGSKSKDGYGQFVLNARRGQKRQRVSPYRFIWEWVHGCSMPVDCEPDHTCNNRQCVNPAHVEPVTHSENQRRAYQRGRKAGVRVRPTHCPKGHEYTTANMMRGGRGPLQCRACNSNYTRRRIVSA